MKLKLFALTVVGIAAKAREEATGRADAVQIEADAQASAIRAVAIATKEAGQDPLFLEIKQLEVQTQQIEKWDGKFNPHMFMNGGEGEMPGFLMTMAK